MPRNWKPPVAMHASLSLHGAAALAIVVAPSTWPWAVSAIAANHVVLTLNGLWPTSSLLGPNITKLPVDAAGRREVAITIDDGPDPQLTPAVLDILDAANAKATFFCMGHKVKQYPEICREIVRRGQCVENHGYTHSWAFSLYGPRRMRADIQLAQEVILDATGQAPVFFRPTAGLRNPLLEPVLCDLDLRLASWTHRAFDTQESNVGKLLGRLTRRLTGGDILLMHDGNSARTTDGQPVILQLLPALLGIMNNRQFKPVTLAQSIQFQDAKATTSAIGQ